MCVNWHFLFDTHFCYIAKDWNVVDVAIARLRWHRLRYSAAMVDGSVDSKTGVVVTQASYSTTTTTKPQ
jgi:hypothetical protein